MHLNTIIFIGNFEKARFITYKSGWYTHAQGHTISSQVDRETERVHNPGVLLLLALRVGAQASRAETKCGKATASSQSNG